MFNFSQHNNTINKKLINTLAIGNFDGIHLGHMELINRLGDNGALCVINKNSSNLTPGYKRSEYSLQKCVYYDFMKIKNLSGKEFIELLQKEFINLKKIVVGYDFKFGKKRSCEAKDLKLFFDGDIEIVEEFIYDGISVHSTYIRELLLKGDISRANEFLGRSYLIDTEIVMSQNIENKNSYTNLTHYSKEYLVPKSGVYLTRIKVPNQIYYAISYIDLNSVIKTQILGAGLDKIDTNIQIYFEKNISEGYKAGIYNQVEDWLIKEAKKSQKMLIA